MYKTGSLKGVRHIEASFALVETLASPQKCADRA